MYADLVLEGGGVKGIALVGALTELQTRGHEFRRVAGTSAGAMVGSLVAAGVTADKLTDIMRAIDYRKFRDADWLQRATGPLGNLAALMTHTGLHEGDYLVNFLEKHLSDVHVNCFADLPALDGPAGDVTRTSRLVVLASDITSRRLAYLPWDYQTFYGVDPGRQRIAHAVRASMAIPFFFRPYHLTEMVRHDDGSLHEVNSILVDGGMLSNFPVDVFDCPAGEEPKWPTFGLKLSANTDQKDRSLPAVIHGPVEHAMAMLATMTSFYDAMHVSREEVRARTIFIDTFGIRSTDFDLSADDQKALYESGQKAVRKFLSTWDFKTYTRRYRAADPLRTATPPT